MTTPRLSFRSITIHRMPGFERGGLDVPELSPGVSVVHGPNASGKTTLGRAIRTLLRPDEPSNYSDSVRATIELDGQRLVLEYDAGRSRCERQDDGTPLDYPKLSPVEIGSRHVLALQDLIQSECDGDLAKAIVKELAGGYDVARAAEQLEFRKTPSTKRQPGKDYREAEQAYRAALDEQDKLAHEETRLSELRGQEAEARQAQERLKLLEKARQFRRADGDVRRIHSQLGEFPSGVAKTAAHDVERLERLKETLESAQEDRHKASDNLDSAQARAAQCDLPDEGVSAETTETLGAQCERLARLRDDGDRAREKLVEATAQRDKALRTLGDRVTTERAERLDADALDELFQVARQAEKVRNQQDVAQQLRQWLVDEEPTADPDRLRDAVACLHRWLAADDARSALQAAQAAGRPDWSDPRLHLAVVGLFLMALSILMAFVHLTWLLLLPLGIAVAASSFWLSRATRSSSEPGAGLAGADPRQGYRDEFESLDTELPESWSPGDVRRHARYLEELLAAAALSRERTNRWGDLDEQRRRLDLHRKDVDQRRAALIERLGIDVQGDNTESSLWLLAANLDAALAAARDVDAAGAALEESTRRYESLLDDVNRSLLELGLEAVDDPEQAASRVRRLDRRRQDHDSAAKDIQTSQAALVRLDESIRKTNRELGEHFERFDLTVEDQDEAKLRDWAAQRNEYDAMERQLREARGAYKSARAELADHPDLLGASDEGLAAEEEAAKRRADALESVSREIGGIEQGVASASRGVDLEAKLARRRHCAEELRRHREGDYEAMAGSVLAAHVVDQEEREQHSRVLRRARDLFLRITKGRYELNVRRSDPPEFSALDVAEERALTLDQLSSGTRLQLLLAARVAFVEAQEQGVKAPLILDETLGNSDELRAEAIIQAVVEICRDGRQVFYFTAQHDEVAKWKNLLADHKDVPHAVIDLAELRQFSETERVPSLIREPYERPPVPEPEGDDWMAYGERLNRPRFDPAASIAGIHLWYLIHDPSQLHRLLRGGINNWGQLQALAAAGHAEGIGPDCSVYRQAEAAAAIIDAAAKAWRVGRGKPVDRAVLVDSGAVSSAFIDRVAELAVEKSRDAKTILAALEQGAVKGFRADKRNTLGEHLHSTGHLTEQQVLSPGEIRERVRPLAFTAIDQRLLDRERVELLVQMTVD